VGLRLCARTLSHASAAKAKKWQQVVSPHRKRNVINLDIKLSIIEEMKKGESQRLVSELYGVLKSTVADIWKIREKIQYHVS